MGNRQRPSLFNVARPRHASIVGTIETTIPAGPSSPLPAPLAAIVEARRAAIEARRAVRTARTAIIRARLLAARITGGTPND